MCTTLCISFFSLSFVRRKKHRVAFVMLFPSISEAAPFHGWTRGRRASLSDHATKATNLLPRSIPLFGSPISNMCNSYTGRGGGETPLHQLSNTLLPCPSSLNACVQYLSSSPLSHLFSLQPSSSPSPLFCLLLFFHGGWFFRSPPSLAQPHFKQHPHPTPKLSPHF